MGYARTKLEQVEAERDALQAKLEAAEQRFNHLASEVREMATDLLEGNEGDKAIGRGWLELLKPTNYPEQPPCDNAHVAPGCEQFQSAEHEALQKENEQLKKACVEVIEMLELTQSPIAVERAVARLSALVKEGKA